MHKGNQSVVLPLGTQVFDLLVLFGKTAMRCQMPADMKGLSNGSLSLKVCAEILTIKSEIIWANLNVHKAGSTEGTC